VRKVDGEKSIWVFSESKTLIKELISGGQFLANLRKIKLVVVLIGSKMEELVKEIARYNVDKILVVDNPKLQNVHVENYADVLANIMSEKKPEIFLLGSTKVGKELASRVAAKLDVGCITDCSKLSISDDGQLSTERTVYSGKAIVMATFTRKPQIAAVFPRTFEMPKPNGNQSQIVKVEIEPKKPKVEVVRIDSVDVAGAKIEDANIIVCGGRGIDKQEDFRKLEELAQLLNGQVGNTRPLAEDRKWFTGWIGLSGKKVKPTLYIGCGVSGMVQHVAGMRDSKIVIAINKDPEAALFEVADYILIGDLNKILPAFVDALKNYNG
jgi:electron transfer flavoprotein alpha subunit